MHFVNLMSFLGGCIPRQSFREPDTYLGTFSMKSIRHVAAGILMQDLSCTLAVDVDRARSECIGRSSISYMLVSSMSRSSLTDRN